MSVLKDRYSKLIELLDSMLRDDSPISDNEQWACFLDDSILRLKIWGETIEIDNGSLERAGVDRQLGTLLREAFDDVLEKAETAKQVMVRALKDRPLGLTGVEAQLDPRLAIEHSQRWANAHYSKG
jgi:hypothetical protein